MKKLLVYSVMMILGMAFTGCASLGAEKALEAQQEIPKTSLNIRFTAERVQPMDGDVIRVMYGLQRAQPFNILDPGYELKLKNGKLSSELPYFGRAFRPRYGGTSEDQGIYLNTEEFRLMKAEGKKNAKILTIIPQDQSKVSAYYLTYFQDGNGYLVVTFPDRQSVSFSGRVTGSF